MKNYETRLYDYIEPSTGKHVVKATTTYAGKSVYAYAKCDPEDKFDLVFGEQLALKRLDLKIAQRRAASMSAKVSRCQKELNWLEQEKRHTMKVLKQAELAVLDRRIESNVIEAEISKMLKYKEEG